MESALLIDFKTYVKKFEKQVRRTRREISPKNVHQLRVTVRRIRAVLWLAEHGTPSLSFGKLKVKLRQLGQALGSLREIDVAIRDAEKHDLPTNRLKKKRKSARRDLKRQMTAKPSLKMMARLDEALGKIKKRREFNISHGVSLLQKRILPWTHRVLRTGDDFHRLRIITKKTRYALEAIGKPSRPLRDLQEILGKGHDLEVLQNYLGKEPALQAEMKKQYNQARRLVRPTIRFAVKSLNKGIILPPANLKVGAKPAVQAHLAP